MTRLVMGFLLLTTVDTSAHILFKLTASGAAPLEASVSWIGRVLTQWWVYAAIACYVATFFVWISLLRRAPVGTAFAVSHLDVVTVMAGSALLLHEHISWIQIAGAVLILGGIGCLSASEARDAVRAES